MNEHPYLAIGQEVEFVGLDRKTIKATITEVIGPDAARVEWRNGSAVADWSDKNSPCTFHFPASATASAKAEK